MRFSRNGVLDELGISADAVAARGLREYQEAHSLEIAEVGNDGREHLLIPEAAAAWRSLKAAALQDGIVLFVVSAFRSVARQTEIIRAKLDRGASIQDVLTISAAPGFSEHHTGRAIDISTPGTRSLEVEFDQSAAFAWLGANADRFGFSLSYPNGNSLGYQFEPWHWCYRPTDIERIGESRVTS